MTFKAGTRRVMMFRQDLEDMPQYSLPLPYTIRWYNEGDEQHWLTIKAQADRFHQCPALYFDRLGSGDQFVSPVWFRSAHSR